MISAVFTTITTKIPNIGKLAKSLPVEIFENESRLIARDDYIAAAKIFNKLNPDDGSSTVLAYAFAKNKMKTDYSIAQHIKKNIFGYVWSLVAIGAPSAALVATIGSGDPLSMMPLVVDLLLGSVGALCGYGAFVEFKKANTPEYSRLLNEATKNKHANILQKAMHLSTILDENMNNELLLLFQILDVADNKVFNNIWNKLPRNVLEQLDPSSDYWRDVEDQKLKDEIMKAAAGYQERMEKMRQESLIG